ncbi:MAG: LPS export ABC transporter periplasmic protein LptC [Chitinophagales bacterium]
MKTKFLKYQKAAGLWLSCLFLCVAVSCKTDMQRVDALFTDEEVQYDVAYDPVMIYTEEGEKRLEITAPLLKSYNKNPRRTEFTEGLKVAFYSGKTNTSNLTANYGENNEQKKELVVEGNVVFKNNKGEQLETEKLTWIEKEAKIKTEYAITITTPTEIITGYGLEADEDFSNYTINSISGIVNIEDE